MGKILEQMEQLNSFSGLSVIVTTVLTVMFFQKYAQKKLPSTMP